MTESFVCVGSLFDQNRLPDFERMLTGWFLTAVERRLACDVGFALEAL